MLVSLKKAEMVLRKLAPAPLRRLYRLIRAAGGGSTPSCELPPELFTGGRLTASRYHLLGEMPKGGVVAELGTWRGDFAREILSRTQPERLHVVDVDFSAFDEALLGDPHITAYFGLTTQFLAQFPDAHFDWIYVDADHSYDAAIGDARASAPKIKPGGFLVFNDFGHIDPSLGRYGVHRAVADFARESRWPIAWLAYQPAALYDVALRKPEGPP